MMTMTYQVQPRDQTVAATLQTTAAVLRSLDADQRLMFTVRLATLLAAVWPLGFEADLIQQLRAEGEALRAT